MSDVLKELFDASSYLKGLFGGTGAFAGGLGEPFGIQGKEYGVEGADNLPKSEEFDPADYFNPKDYFNADDLANETLTYAVRRAMGNG